MVSHVRDKMDTMKAERYLNCHCYERCDLCRCCKKLKKTLCKGHHIGDVGATRKQRAMQEIVQRVVYEHVFDLVDERVLVQEMLQGAPFKGVRDAGHNFRMKKLYKLAMK